MANYIDSKELTEYPFDGTFYIPADTKGEDGDIIGDTDETSEDGDLLGEDEEETVEIGNTSVTVTQLTSDDEDETIVLETKCDIQEATKGFSLGAITASFNVYFPFGKQETMEVRRGHMFRSEMYGMPIQGIVVGVYPCQMGGVVAYIKDTDS